MKIVQVVWTEEVTRLLEQIFSESSPEHLLCHGDEYLLYLLEHLAHALGGKSYGRIYANYQAPSEGFRNELQGLVQRVAISARNIIAHRNHCSVGRSVDDD